ncbi:sigma factor, partial [Streptomyces sp. NPDC005921]
MSAPSPDTTTPAEPSTARPDEDDLDLALDVFLAQRTRLFRIAYRILGDASGAEDVVQEVWLRWQLTHRASIENPAAFLTTATTRLAINVIQSGRHRHETPADPQAADLGDRSTQDPLLNAEPSAFCGAQVGRDRDRAALLQLGCDRAGGAHDATRACRRERRGRGG